MLVGAASVTDSRSLKRGLTVIATPRHSFWRSERDRFEVVETVNVDHVALDLFARRSERDRFEVVETFVPQSSGTMHCARRSDRADSNSHLIQIVQNTIFFYPNLAAPRGILGWVCWGSEVSVGSRSEEIGMIGLDLGLSTSSLRSRGFLQSLSGRYFRYFRSPKPNPKPSPKLNTQN